MNIRDAQKIDLPAIVNIYNASIPSRLATADLEPVSVQSRSDWFEQHSPTFRPIWVVEVSGAIAAWLSFQSFYGRPAYNATAEVSIYVDPAYHRRGLGKLLLAKAIQQSPTLNIKTLVGFIFAHNHPSLKLFEIYGFQHWGYLPKIAELDSIERDLVILGRRIRTEKK
ncbi:MAG: GNAT family N-acetyltransferase [Nostocaceae cyanobacterium]|nr:GNAT family N-acetyltransferase [Nostocaceae cyanobacterium]